MPRRQRITLGVFLGVVVVVGYLFNEYRPIPAVPRQTGWARPSAQGVRLMNEGRLDEAEAKFRAALTLAEQDADDYGRGTSYQNLGQLKLAGKQYREAEELFRRALPLVESSQRAGTSQRAVLMNDLAICCVEGGRTAEAVSLMKRAVALDDDEASDVTRAERVQRLRNYALALLADSRPIEAANAATRASALEGPAPTTIATRPSARE